ncbi:citrate lyase subunit alpha [Spiroplasma endosymbiont of Stenodema calcarata]|uniref:citrate lyase subunit alpha n=1 Tax=Spiroplasma endosymbiont of Stenodema calcarata TaxID=3139328 RepID=UPI003CCB6560
MAKYLNQEQLKQINKNHNYESYDSVKSHTSKFINYQTELPNYGKRKTKLVDSLEEAIIKSGLKDGMTISFHHHFRHGDKTVEQVLKIIKKLKIKNLTISASSFTKAHDCLIDYIKSGVVTGLEGSALRGKLGDAISEGILPQPAIIRSHGGRARAIESGESHINVAFLAASTSDEMGNANGSHGTSSVGAFGYPMVDAQYADKVIIITDTIVSYPNNPISIPQTNVDYVVKVDEIGDSSKISSGEIHTSFSPKEIKIAQNIVKVITNTPGFKNGFSYQTGTGGASQSSLIMLGEEMVSRNIKAGFFLGGIIGEHVKFLETGLVDKLLDVQCFDLIAAQSIKENANHIEISASYYANPHTKGCATDKLDYGILSALEVDINFDINVLTGADGYIRGASGGHSDVAFGSDVSIVAVPLIRGRIPSITTKVQTVVTPGGTVDVVVTETGIAVNPLRKDLIEILNKAGVELKTITQLRDEAYTIIGQPQMIEYDKEHPVAIVEYRDGSVIDIIYKVKPYILD